MNKIVESLLRDFKTEHGLNVTVSDDVAFEHFAANLTIGVLANGVLNTEDCVVGEDAQPGVDALGVIINGSFVRDLDEVETYIEMNGYLDVDFVFVQAKTSASFDVSALGNLGDTVERLFESGPIAVDNEKVHSFCALKDAIFSKSRAFKRRNPAVHLYYVSSGSTPYEDANFSAKERLIVNRLLKPGTLSSAHVMLAKFSDADAAENALKPAFDVVSKLMAGKSRDLPRTSGFTQSLKDAIEELKRSGNAKPQRTARKRSSKV